MKKLLYLVGGFFALVIGLILTILAVVFIEPTILVNEKNITWLLQQTKVLETWTWQKLEIDHEWKSWKNRRLTGDIRDLCLKYKEGSTYYACFSEISWDFDLGYEFGEGMVTKTHSPLTVISPQVELNLVKASEPREKGPPPDIYGYWSMIWNSMIPDLDMRFDSIHIQNEGKATILNFSLAKVNRSLEIKAMNFTLVADPEGFELLAPPKYEVPVKNDLVGPLNLLDVKLTGKVTPKKIPLALSGSLEEASFDVKALLKLPLREDPGSLAFRRNFLSTVRGEVLIREFQDTFSRRAPARYSELPAPLNVMDGFIKTRFQMAKGNSGEVNFSSDTRIRLASKKEVLDMNIAGDANIPVVNFRPDSITIGIVFNKVKLELPRLSKKSPPPQFYPDKRFQKEAWSPPKEKKKGPVTDVDLHFEAPNKKSLHLVTNLLDEPLRFNFDLFIGGGEVQEGHVTILPLKTEIFKRPIHVKSLKVKFAAPEEPVIKAEIQFPLPEYKITMDLEGPVSDPVYVFRSEPPLPQNDIYAVLLFGRPLRDLDPDDKSSAQKTNEILAQGILSLSVLYFLAGSPVEYVGYDPDSESATASFGLTDKTSLQVGGSGDGLNSTGLRHSLGKGWYIDTTVQDTRQNEAARRSNNYGVLLERVIAY